MNNIGHSNTLLVILVTLRYRHKILSQNLEQFPMSNVFFADFPILIPVVSGDQVP